MNRPKPTEKLLSELCGNDPALIASVHHGLYETPLYEIYPFLNFDDLIVFEAASWNLRKRDIGSYRQLVKSASLYEIFHETYKSNKNPKGMQSFAWLYNNKELCPKNEDIYFKLNPFHKKDLKLRLEKVDFVAESKFRNNLISKVNDYLFECDYTQKIRAYQDHRIILINFQTYYPKKGRTEKRYAKEIAKNLLSRYPTEYSFDYEKQVSLF